MKVNVQQVRVGRLQPLANSGLETGIFKQPVTESWLAETGLQGDQQGDTRHHGGVEKALHHYPAEHYLAWCELLPELAAEWQPGAFGENISAYGLTEVDVCIGDIFTLGESQVQVSQARQPCWRLNQRFGHPGVSLAVQQQMRTGWYYRVLQPGRVWAGCELQLLERPHPGWSLQRILELFYRDCLNRPALVELAALPELADSWRTVLQRRLDSGAVEDWQHRLYGAA